MPISFTLHKQAPVQFGWAEMQHLHIAETQQGFTQLQACAAIVKKNYGDVALAEIPGVQAARQFFRSIGIDPTKRRPSSESLLNRALKAKGFFAVNELVDIGNWCSLDFLLPICVYDAAQIQGEVHIRLGQPEDTYLALNNRDMDFTDRLVVADDLGAFGSPMTDSLRTAASTQTTHALLGIWAPSTFNAEQLALHTETFINRVQQICGGQVIANGIAR